MAYSKQLNLLAAGLLNGFFEIYDAEYECLQAVKAHNEFISGLCFIESKFWLISSGEDKKIIVWNIMTY